MHTQRSLSANLLGWRSSTLRARSSTLRARSSVLRARNTTTMVCSSTCSRTEGLGVVRRGGVISLTRDLNGLARDRVHESIRLSILR
jgi:hypothetical protein